VGSVSFGIAIASFARDAGFHLDWLDRPTGASMPGASDSPAPSALVVDDDPAVAALLGAFLDRMGIAVTVTHAWPAASDLLTSRCWDLLVTDLELQPGRATGADLIRLARERHPSIATMLVSGSASADASFDGLAEADCFLPKPVAFGSFAAAVRDLLDGR
jgi:two-component system response regulator PilR (NtrC family)